MMKIPSETTYELWVSNGKPENQYIIKVNGDSLRCTHSTNKHVFGFEFTRAKYDDDKYQQKRLFTIKTITKEQAAFLVLSNPNIVETKYGK